MTTKTITVSQIGSTFNVSYLNKEEQGTAGETGYQLNETTYVRDVYDLRLELQNLLDNANDRITAAEAEKTNLESVISDLDDIIGGL